jgi:hypothetical protein
MLKTGSTAAHPAAQGAAFPLLLEAISAIPALGCSKPG